VIRRFAVLAAVIGIVAGVLVVASPPASAQYNPGEPGCILDPAQINADTETPGVIQCINCPPSTPGNPVIAEAFIVVSGNEIAIGSAQVSDDEDGPVTIPVLYPALPDGDYTIIVRCGPVLLSNVLTVVGTGGQVAGPLPRTGSDSGWLLRLALILITVGGLLALATRKRRHAYD
jgi:LPXTG-motif cell wall-anchored protein